MMVTFDVKNTKYYTYETEKYTFVNGEEVKLYDYRGFGYIYQGASRQIMGLCDVKFKNYKEFEKFCRALVREKTDPSIEKVYMTRGGNCVVKKYKD